jgi:SAM-dependent methyltransferase
MYPALTDDGPFGHIANDARVAARALTGACRRLVSLPERVPSQSAHAFHQVVSLIHGICEALVACETAGVDNAELRRIVGPAREVHARSPFIKRLQEWPRGYPGDFETIEWLWRAENRGDGPLAQAFERYALTASIAQQHRNKVAFQAACILEALEQHSACRILSLACGSSPDIRSILGHVRTDAGFVLCDSDPDALAFCAQKLEKIAGRCTFVHGMVPRVLRSIRGLGPYHLIFAGGLFDYLPDRFVQRTIATAWSSLLAPGGRIVFTNIADGNPFRVWLEYLADWRLIERTEHDIERICRDAGVPAPVEMTRDSTGLAILASIRRPESEPR